MGQMISTWLGAGFSPLLAISTAASSEALAVSEAEPVPVDCSRQRSEPTGEKPGATPKDCEASIDVFFLLSPSNIEGDLPTNA